MTKISLQKTAKVGGKGYGISGEKSTDPVTLSSCVCFSFCSVLQ